ncbi:MAG: sigma-70 family RNA polymerase sigma factor [Actinomycetota bacterium]|nr:sigma-70 family RNA polymerase sigma factor [Actinomycetota bacterium]
MAQLEHVDTSQARPSTPHPATLPPTSGVSTASDSPAPLPVRDELIAGHLGLARAISRRYTGRGIDREDLFQVASLALVHASDRFDPAHGAAFSAYASVCVHGELKRYLRDHGWAVRPPRALHDLHHHVAHATVQLTQVLAATPTVSDIAHYLEVDPGQVRAAQKARTAYTAASWEALTQDNPDPLLFALSQAAGPDTFDTLDASITIRAILSDLPPRQQQIVQLRFVHELTQQEIGDQLGMSQMHVSRMLTSITTKLRSKLTPTKDRQPER